MSQEAESTTCLAWETNCPGQYCWFRSLFEQGAISYGSMSRMDRLILNKCLTREAKARNELACAQEATREANEARLRHGSDVRAVILDLLNQMDDMDDPDKADAFWNAIFGILAEERGLTEGESKSLMSALSKLATATDYERGYVLIEWSSELIERYLGIETGNDPDSIDYTDEEDGLENGEEDERRNNCI